MAARTGICTLSKLQKTLVDNMISFTRDKNIKKSVHDPDSFAMTVYETYFGRKFEEAGSFEVSPGEVRGFTNRLNKIRRLQQSGKLNGVLGEMLYNTSARAKNNPYTSKLLNELIDVNYVYKGHQDRGRELFRNVLDGIKKEAKVEGFLSKGARDFKTALKKADEFDDMLYKARAEGNHSQWADLLAKEKQFYAEKEGRILKDFIETIETDLPKLAKDIKKEYLDKKHALFNKAKADGKTDSEAHMISNRVREDRLIKVIHKLGKPAHIEHALVNYVKMMDNSYKTLEKGVDAYVDLMAIGMKDYKTPEEIKALSKKIKENLMPDYEIGYYPHYRRDLNIDAMQGLMPHMQQVSDSMSLFLNSKTPAERKKHIDKAFSSMNGYVTPRAKGRSKAVDDQMISKNFLSNVKRYLDEIDNFNYVAHADLKTRQMYEKVKSDFKEGKSDGYGMDVVRLIGEMNQSMKGKNTGFEDPNIEAFTKAIMSMEFTSKLGLNLRGAMKNSTQWLPNVVEYGPKMMHDSKQYYKTHPEIWKKMDQARRDAGLKFGEGDLLPELKESYGGERKISERLKINEDLSLNYEGPTWMERAAGKGTKWAAKSGIFMRKVENRNRADTFEFAYYREYNTLDNNIQWKEQMRKEGKDPQKLMESRARRYAINQVTMLHFDYSALSKSKYLRSPVGRLMGQFQHYGYKFMEYNFKLVKDAKNDVVEGQLMGQNAMKAYRMGMVYFLAPAFLEMVTGLNWGNLIEHDSKGRMEQLSALMSGTDEEIKKAFYGRGIISGILGFPMLSDALALGNIFEIWNMDEDTKLALLAGFRDYADVSKDRKAYEIIKIINTSMGRLFSQTGPMMYSGNIGAAFQFEASLYPSKKAKEKKEAMEESAAYMGEMLPDEIQEVLKALKEESSNIYEASKQNPYKS